MSFSEANEKDNVRVQQPFKKVTIRELFFSKDFNLLDYDNCGDIELNVKYLRHDENRFASHFIIGDSTGSCPIWYDRNKNDERTKHFTEGKFLSIKNPILRSGYDSNIAIGAKTTVKEGHEIENVVEDDIHNVKRAERERKAEEDKANRKEKCEGCKEPFPIAVFLRHVSHSKACKEAYRTRWPDLQKEKRRLINKNNYRKTKNKLKSKYQENKEKLKKKYLEKS